jgi:phosphoglycolate phosphatase-like HAD superfamily hydrolase
VRLLFLVAVVFNTLFHLVATDPLPSWNEGVAKSAILQFVQDVTEEGSANFVPPEKRIATFDQDGTLWVEQPMYAQGFFAFERIHALAPEHPEWKEQEPFKAILNDNKEAMSNFSESNIAEILAATHAGMTVEDFIKTVQAWLSTATHPRFKKPFTQLIYQPMLEVIQLFEANGFTNYIVSGGGQEFIRVYAEPVYGIPVERIIGTAAKVNYELRQDRPVLIKLPQILFIDDKKGKPESINLFIGKRPTAAFGNSEGDRQMLEWTKAGQGKRLALLVHHDDSVREYAYDQNSKIGTFPASLMDEALQHNWIVVSMKNDWKRIFSYE